MTKLRPLAFVTVLVACLALPCTADAQSATFTNSPTAVAPDAPQLPSHASLFPSLPLHAFAGAVHDPAPDEPIAHSRAFSVLASARPKRLEIPSPGDRPTRPLKSLAVGFTAGLSGLGVDLSTPLADRYNVRLGASFLGFSAGFQEQGVPVTGTIHLASARAILDYAPTGRSFHISPGITFYNRDHYLAAIYIQGVQTISFNDQTYTSDPADPIHGVAVIRLANRAAPRITVGWGNMIRHRTAHFTFPVEFGVEFINTPTISLSFAGSACDSTGYCSPINGDPSTQQNITDEQNNVNSELKPLRFFPIFSFGVSYKFGH